MHLAVDSTAPRLASCALARLSGALPGYYARLIPDPSIRAFPERLIAGSARTTLGRPHAAREHWGIRAVLLSS